MKLAFLSSIYPAHVRKIYRENPDLKNKSSDEQMEFIRWHALSSYFRWTDLLEEKGFQTCGFNHNLPEVSLAWAKENKFTPKSNNSIWEIGLEKIKKFKPDIIFTFAPLDYKGNGFIDELICSLSKNPKLIAWYGANCGDEKIFRYFDLTLSNSKHLVNSLRAKNISADFLQHSFDPIILEKINIPENPINKVAFFGNLDVSTCDFRERTRLLEEISKKTKLLDIYGEHTKPSRQERTKHALLASRQKIAKSINKVVSNNKIKYWSDEKHLPPTPWPLDKEFCSRIQSPLYGQQMLEKLSSYRVAINYHNKHTGNYACNMRLFEASGLGCALITDGKSDLNEYFETDKEIITYNSVDDAYEKIKFLTQNPKWSEKIAILGQKRCLNFYNTENQITRLSKILNELKF